MSRRADEDFGFGITCIDAGYMGPGVACFYLLERDGECAVVETGTNHSVAALLSVMESRGLRPEQVRYVIPTHVHLDHAGGAGSMMSHFHKARLLIHPRGSSHMIDPARLVAGSIEVYGEQQFQQLYGEIIPVDAERVTAMEDGDSCQLGSTTLEFRHTRGHADHHLCIWDETSGGWFSGDMFGVSYDWFRRDRGDYVMPATTPTQFRPEEFLQSLQLLQSYDPRAMYLTHYGELCYTPEVHRLLAEQVKAYPELARASPEPVALAQAIVALSHKLMCQIDDSVTESEAAKIFGLDAKLNAQGLMVWLQRQATAGAR